jgi:hypothetical protein
MLSIVLLVSPKNGSLFTFSMTQHAIFAPEFPVAD